MGGNLALHLMWIEIIGQGIDVYEDGPRAQAANRAGAGKEREGGHDHFVAWADLQGLEGQKQGVGAGGAADGIAGAGVAGYLLLKGGYLGTKNYLAAGKHAPHRLLEQRLQFLVLRL